MPKDARVRPTADRVREAWMSILGDELAGARVLDLFAGSGALGLEALSRGAESVTFVELNPPSLRALHENISALGAEASRRPCTGETPCASPSGCRRPRSTWCWPIRRIRWTTPPGWWRSSAAPRSGAFFRSSTAATSSSTATHPPLRRHRHHLLPRAMTRIAVYPGSFDPPTRGHEDLVRRSLALADRLIVAVAMNVGKQPLFSVEERLEMLRTAVGRRSAGLLPVVRRSAGGIRQEGRAPPSSCAGCAR